MDPLSAAVAVSAAVVGVLLVGALTAVAVVVRGQSAQPQVRTDPAQAQELGTLRGRIDALELKVEGLPSLWEHEKNLAVEAKKHADKQWAKVRAESSRLDRAQREDDEPDTDPFEDADVLRIHAAGGGGEGVHAMSADMGVPTQDDLTRAALAAGWSPFL